MKRKTITRKIKKLIVLDVIFSLIVFPSTIAMAEANPSIPKIISREDWGADESKMTWEAEYADIKTFIIHHTASTTLKEDSDGSGKYKEMVQNIYNYHTNGKLWKDGNGSSYTGFGDVGYNYLIDPEGNIYEGRDGGNGVIGGHASGFNEGSVGISVIGTYQEDSNYDANKLSNSILTSLGKLIGWIAANNNININKTIEFKGKTIDGVVGHKDVTATLCPGNVLYDELGDIQSTAYSYSKEYKNHLYQIKGKDAIYAISGGYKIKFDSKDALPSTYKDKEIEYITKSQLAAYEYKDIKKYPDGTLLQEIGENTVYYLQNGKKRPLGATETEFMSLGFSKDDIIDVLESDLDIYETGDKILFGPEGTLIKDADANVYYIENGKKKLFTSAQLFEHLGYSWTKVKADANAAYYLEGDIMRYPDETLVRAAGASDVYLMNNGKRRKFISADLFLKLGYKWKDVIDIDESEINRYQIAGNVIYPDGTLIRTTNGSTVYLVQNEQKREITSETLLKKLGYSFANVVEIAPENLSDYANGARATYPDGTLIKTKTSAAVYQVEGSAKKEFTSLNLFNAIGAKWSNVIEIEDGEMALYTTGGTVKYPEGALLRQNGGSKIYVMKNGTANWISSAEEFLAAGYKWSAVMDIEPLEMKLYVDMPEIPAEEKKEEVSEDDTTDEKEDVEEEQSADDENVSLGEEPNIRVALTSSTEDNIIITADGNYSVKYYHADGTNYKTVNKTAGQNTVVPYFNWDKYIRFVPESDNVILQVLSYNDAYQYGSTAYNDNRFRGVIELKYSSVSNKLWVIEDVPLEDYLRGISEATTRTDSEYLKAFAIITRTYAMNYIVKGGKHTGEPFMLKNSRNGNGNDQQYKGYSFEMRSPTTANSYGQTEGQVIEYNDKPIVAAYSSDSGGVTKDACQVLTPNYCTEDYAYLRGGIKDPENTVHNASSIAASHGAGMSATGAYQMALNGSDWEEIIKYYYPGVEIEEYY
ncbi:MAG: N-acetylmuramoyl-L-alanine amidase [Candidatus Pacebacteria bacterium]|nr:N-acetylmuramoyl-L-alanine amidase [Candidatus Paceibacterota bacterium]